MKERRRQPSLTSRPFSGMAALTPGLVVPLTSLLRCFSSYLTPPSSACSAIILFQVLYGLMGTWIAYLISILYVEYRTRMEREKVYFINGLKLLKDYLESIGESLYAERGCIASAEKVFGKMHHN
ncbi:Auxin transporter-like protein 2 [Dendrobium catenatum]|uniref:Auxin transporter-like protein 2 n=1 Tax=Dendrobium catenatum TaxID=906689 RepID=A0A2I0VHS7_9ASPA|nr:Auxin transporter-like protein 2 [Dendrobium catenatum]